MDKQAYEASVMLVLEKRAAENVPGTLSNTQIQQDFMRRNGSRLIRDGIEYSAKDPRWGKILTEHGLRLKSMSYMPLGIKRRMKFLEKGINPDAPAMYVSDYMMIPDDATGIGMIPELEKGNRAMSEVVVSPDYKVPFKGRK